MDPPLLARSWPLTDPRPAFLLPTMNPSLSARADEQVDWTRTGIWLSACPLAPPDWHWPTSAVLPVDKLRRGADHGHRWRHLRAGWRWRHLAHRSRRGSPCCGAAASECGGEPRAPVPSRTPSRACRWGGPPGSRSCGRRSSRPVLTASLKDFPTRVLWPAPARALNEACFSPDGALRAMLRVVWLGWNDGGYRIR